MNPIREKCLDCCAGSSDYVKTCTCIKCSLWEHRFGRLPKTIKEKAPLLVDKEFFAKHINLQHEEFIKLLGKTSTR